MTWRLPGIATILLNAAVVAAGLTPDAVSDKPLTEQGYAGLVLRDIPGGHAVVSWIFPGPLEGEGLTAPKFDLARPDLIVSVDGEPMTAERFKVLVHSSAPGDSITIEYLRSNHRGSTIPDALDHEDEARTIEVVLASRQEWTGTIGRPRGHDTSVEFTEPHLLDPFDTENVLGAAVAEQGLTEPLRTLLGVFSKWQAKDEDFHSLSRVRAGFDNPFCLPQLADMTSLPWRRAIPFAAPELNVHLAESPVAFAGELLRESLDSEGVGGMLGGVPLASGSTQAGGELAQDMLRLDYDMANAFRNVPRDRQFARQCLEFLRVPRESFYITGPKAKEHIDVIRHSMDVDWHWLGNALHSFETDEIRDKLQRDFPDNPPIEDLRSLRTIPPPDELADAVEGLIIAAHHEEELGWIVVGSVEPNRYDMAKIAGVIDPGGNDEYYATDLRLGCRVIIDLAGDDLYTGTPEQGPGSALLGVSFIDDRAGNDRYQGELLSAGAAMFGVSLLLDRGGNDIYIGREWSLGAACYGAGMIFDLGDGNDQYLGDFLCEGVGGPRGFGCIIDQNGRDLYRANGPTPSAYGTPAVYQSFSQGIGFGFRHYAAGGIGLISDLGGDDRYEAGEFAQGGAYYYGLGILHDAKGRDIYYGNRYGQGFGVHQAIGILADDEGDDTYWSMTAASQGAAWDIGVGLLIDRAGNDSYQADGLAQGSASMQAIGMLLDLAGVDRYVARGGATQGQSGGDAYHYHETGAFSFSLLLDAGGGNDWYSTGRANNATMSTGRLEEDRPQASSLHGLFVDR